MDLSEIVAITGMPGLFKVSNLRNDGLIVSTLVDDKTQFVPGRTHLFTTLDNITIYTNEDTTPLKGVLASIKKHEAKHAVPDGKNDADLKAWMEKVLPEYEKEKVHTSDMKKLAKWYTILNAKNLIEELTSEKKEEEKTDKKEEGATTEKKEVTAAAKKSSKPKKQASNTSAKTASKPAPPKKITTPRKAT